jgi:hypothetical protein
MSKLLECLLGDLIGADWFAKLTVRLGNLSADKNVTGLVHAPDAKSCISIHLAAT